MTLIQTTERGSERTVRPTRTTAGLLGAAGVFLGVGGQLHPRGEGDTLDEALASMLGSDAWAPAHVLLLVGVVLAVAGFSHAYRHRTFGGPAGRWLLVAIVGWGLGAVELVPHLFATQDLAGLEDHGETPLVDAHLLLQTFVSPALGLSGAAVAIAVALTARTKPAWVLAAFAVIGGVAFALAGPLVNGTDDPGFAVLFAGDAGLAVWLVGTAIRLGRAKPSVAGV
jgi:hypothetical protein